MAHDNSVITLNGLLYACQIHLLCLYPKHTCIFLAKAQNRTAISVSLYH